eukprot:1146482-Pelagomonas_calceolata.AAC.2
MAPDGLLTSMPLPTLTPHARAGSQELQLAPRGKQVIADPSGNLYRVVHDQLMPLMPHELEQHSMGMVGGSGSGTSQSPGLATLAAAAAAAVGGVPGGAQGSRGEASVAAAAAQPPQLQHQHANLGGGMYGAPTSFHGQPQYLMLPQHMGMGYNGLSFQGVSQPLYMDSMGNSGGYMGSQPMLSMPMSFPMGSQPSPAGLPMGSYSLLPQHMASSNFSMPSQPPLRQQPSSGGMPMSTMAPLMQSMPAP